MKRCVIGLCGLAIAAWLAGSVLAQEAPRGGKGRPGGFQRGGPGGGQRGGSEEGSAGQRRPDPEKIFGYFDKDGDGKLTKEELPERAQARFAEMDENKDGSVSKEEFLAAAKKMGQQQPGGPGRFDPNQMFERADKNKDGKLTKDEVPEAWERISKADEDKDGAVSKEEFSAAMKKMMEARRGEGRGGREGRGGPGQGPGPGQRQPRGEAEKGSE